jgi:hypothetical protein
MSSYNALFGLGSHSVDSALEGWWKLQDDAANTSVADSSGKGYSGTLTNAGNTAASTVAGPNSWLGKAIDLDGVNDFISVSGSGLDIAGAFTVVGFFKSDNPTSVNQTLLGAYDPSTPFAGYGVGLSIGGSSNNGFPYAWTGNGGWFAGNSPSVGTTWRHWFVKNESNTSYIFIDGSSRGSASRTAPSSFTGAKAIGAVSGGGSNRFNGACSGIAVFSRALTNAEAEEHRLGPEPLNTVDPTLTFGASTWTGTIGTWDSQSNGTITYAWELRRDSDDGVEQSGTGASPSGSNPAAGSYYLWVRASNDGGFDAAEDSVSATEVLSAGDDKEGSGTITAIGNVTGSGSTTRSGSGSFAAVGNLAGTGQRIASAAGAIVAIGVLDGSGQKVSSASGTITAIGTLEGTGLAPAVGEQSGFGSIAAIGTLTATGQSVRSGSGSFAAIGILEGTGEAPVVGGASGSGSITAIGSLTGQATTVRSGSGSFGAVGELSGMGRMVAAASGQISAVGNIVGVGSNQQGSMILQYYYYLGS